MPAEPQRFDPERILEVLDRHRVDYVMVGGFASQLHGARRQTYDIDFVTGGRRTFDELVQRCTDVDVDGIVIHLASLDDIIDSKTHADRPKDREALPELHRLRGSTPDV